MSLSHRQITQRLLQHHKHRIQASNRLCSVRWMPRRRYNQERSNQSNQRKIRMALHVVRGESWCRPVVSEERLTRANTGEDMDAVRISARTQRNAATWSSSASLPVAPSSGA